MGVTSSWKRGARRSAPPKKGRRFQWSLIGFGALAVLIVVVGWTLVGWPALVAAGVAAMVVRFS